MFVANRRRERAIALAQRFGGDLGLVRRAARRARAGRHRDRLHRLAAHAARRRGDRRGHGRAPRPAAAARRPRGAARHRRPVRRAARRHACSTWTRCSAPSSRAHAGPPRRGDAAPRGSSRRRSRRSRAGSASSRCCRRSSALRARGDEVVDRLLAENAGRWEGLTDADRERVETLARAVVKRLLHEPTVRVKGLEAEQRHARLQLLRELFGLEEPPAARRTPPPPRSAPCGRVDPAAHRHPRQPAGARPGARRRAALDGETELVEITTAGDVDRAARRQVALDRARSRRRCWPATSTSRCTRAKDVPGELAAGHRDRRRAAPRGPARRAGRRARRSTRVREGARVGTSALRRRAQLLAVRPDLEVARAARQRRHAAAQARRGRGRRDRARRRRARAARPARRRGRARSTASCSCRRRARATIAIQARVPSSAADAAAAVSHASTLACLQAERAAIRALGASCHAPVGVLARCVAESLQMRGFAGLPDGSQWVLDEHRAPAGGPGGGRPGARGADGRGRRARRAARGRGDGRVSGIVHLVGAGPGDPGLLTVRAVELIAAADVILHDRLIPREALAHARPDAELVYVGKEGAGAQVPQEDTHAFLLEHARAGRRVVRLKGGDPFVFGRGGEEALVLREAGIPFEVVPGITAGVAAPAYAGIPVTQRDLASGVAFVTGHEDPAKPESALDWPALAAFPGTLVFYMGVRALPRIAERLVAGGRSPRGAGRGDRARHAARPAHAAGHAGRRRRAGRGGGHPRPGDHARRAGGRAARAARVAGVAPAARPHDRRHARPRPGQRAGARGCASSAPRSSRRRRSGSSRWRRRAPDLSRYDLVAVTSPNGAERLLVRSCATRASSPGSRSRRSARARRARCASAASSRTSCPSARSRRASSRRCATCR